MQTADMQKALSGLDKLLDRPLQLLIGGGAAMALAHHLALVTSDIDGLVFRSRWTQAELNPLIHQVADKLGLPKDWLNSYFNTFLYALPADYGSRLIEVYHGKKLIVFALSREDMVILKCMAGRDKDLPHARALMRQGVDRELISNHLQSLMEQGLPLAQAAADFFDELCDQLPT